jgi:predicted DsbA family dithiol-disulfide isomerase
VQIDLYYAPHCSACRRVRPRLRRLVAARGDRLTLRELDVVAYLDEGARVMRTPSIVVNGRVRLAGAMTDAALAVLLRELAMPGET